MLGSEFKSIVPFVFAGIFAYNAVISSGIVDSGAVVNSKRSWSNTLVLSILIIITALASSSIFALLSRFVLQPFEFSFISPICAGIATIVCSYFVFLVYKKRFNKSYQKNIDIDKSLYSFVFIAIVMVLSSRNEYSVLGLVIFTVLQAVGAALVMLIMTGVNNSKLVFASIPEALKGVPIQLVMLGLIALAFSPLFNAFQLS